MFYADFYHYRQTGRSISGLRYRVIQYGPVPEHFDTIYDNIAGIEKTNEITTYGTESTSLTLTSDVSASYLSEHEVETLRTVVTSLGLLKARDLVELSHKETAWLNNRDTHALISYNEAFNLVGI